MDPRDISSEEKIPDNSDAIGCARVFISNANQHEMLPEKLPDVHPPGKLVGSSEIAPFEDRCSASEVKLGPFSRCTHPGGPRNPTDSDPRSSNFERIVLRAPWELDEAVRQDFGWDSRVLPAIHGGIQASHLPDPGHPGPPIRRASNRDSGGPRWADLGGPGSGR